MVADVDAATALVVHAEGRARSAGRNRDACRYRHGRVIARKRDLRTTGGAAPFSVTVPLAEAPPVRLAGLTASAEIAGGAEDAGTSVARHRSTSTGVPESRNT